MNVEEYVAAHPEVPADMIRSVASLAERDADDTAAFLRRAEAAFGEVPQFPALMLFGLGLFSRFARWERHGIRVHLDAGLPSAAQMYQCVAAAPNLPNFSAFVVATNRRATEIFLANFVWNSTGDEMIELALGVGVAEDCLLDALAEFLIDVVPKGIS